ncbi:relaxase/mobilization nuclease domain-containing protein [Pedobacter sp. MR22-3]|uniref:relaxase/mobilization nuclease domain-containing protein n=1 Tax=Pedobacter sp. MR22-3 TaxID=2994552 RepID=UPI002246B983|nr:relaxase/mobilization nuclease domain-containing protein [Pedobacter sp. MR22-3]MCX2584311.1 relaxase/mobilization nuclease domain-containing protein [Pedobacter sp. MR22-3]
MIVKILWKSKTFRAVRYNTNKVEKNKGELLKVSGFGALEGLSEIKPQDYINYLSSLAARNKRVVYPQFHAMISPKGRSLGKEELVTLAQDWLKGMGYGNQPYLLIFHKDTNNNHIHMVSSRVDREGKKISDRYERIRAYRVLNKLIGKDEKQAAEKAIQKALKYTFSTRAQFMMLLERQGYGLKVLDNYMELSKFGEKVGGVSLKSIEESIAQFSPDEERKLQLKQIFKKYRPITDASLQAIRENLSGGEKGKVTGYSSTLSEKLSSSFGLEFVFHFKGDKRPYGYSILDHSRKQVFKGGDIMSLNQFIEPSPVALEQVEGVDTGIYDNKFSPSEAMLLENPTEPIFSPLHSEMNEGISISDFALDIDISDDIDDEQILGRNRRRQKKARTNTR